MRKKNRTVVVFLACYNCGVIISYKEIFGHETIAQAAVFTMEIIQNVFIWPKTLIYDDGCSLKKYVTNKSSLLFKQTTERAKKLAETRIVVDRFHFKSHVDEWCRELCDPDLYDDLKDVNSSICEETNYWFSKYKYIFKHMNYERYHFLLYIVLDEFNEANLIRKIYENEKKNVQL